MDAEFGPPSEDELNELFGDPEEFKPGYLEEPVIILPAELRPLLEWAFTTEEGLASNKDDVMEKAREWGLVDVMAEWGWAYAVALFLTAAKEVQDEVEGDE